MKVIIYGIDESLKYLFQEEFDYHDNYSVKNRIIHFNETFQNLKFIEIIIRPFKTPFLSFKKDFMGDWILV